LGGTHYILEEIDRNERKAGHDKLSDKFWYMHISISFFAIKQTYTF
jgi:hypothetical protein